VTLKGLETDTLYLVFKHRFQIVFGFALQTIQTRPKQTGILTVTFHSVKRHREFFTNIAETKKASQSPRNFRGKATLKVTNKFPVLKPLDAPPKRNGHYRDKNLLVNTRGA
jgi:hypothetical protein